MRPGQRERKSLSISPGTKLADLLEVAQEERRLRSIASFDVVAR